MYNELNNTAKTISHSELFAFQAVFTDEQGHRQPTLFTEFSELHFRLLIKRSATRTISAQWLLLLGANNNSNDDDDDEG